MTRYLSMFALAGVCLAQPQYYSTGFPRGNGGWYPVNGTLIESGGYLAAPSMTSRGSVVSNIAPPTANEYEVRTTYRITENGGSLVTLLRAQPDAQFEIPASNFYAVEVKDPNVSQNVATLRIFRNVSGTYALLGSTVITAWNGMVLRIIMKGSSISVFRDDFVTEILTVSDSSLSTGQPGLGIGWSTPGGNGISAVTLFGADTIAPPQPALPAVSAFDTRVEMQWPALGDNPGGSGIHYYALRRQDPSGQWTDRGKMRRPIFADLTVGPGTTYTYEMKALDVHGNPSAPRYFTVQTAPAGTHDPRQIGIRGTGAYWGGAGEQIDVQTGNLNYTLPLMKAISRNGTSFQFTLNYNSQIWRKDGGGIWYYGRDVGFGAGWRLMVGSIMPVFQDFYSINHYVYTDSTGAEYKLDVRDPSARTWSSKEIALAYEEDTKKLRFNDGTTWLMTAESADGKEDAGTRYPMILQDTNGNQIWIWYRQGRGYPVPHSSARISAILDTRAQNVLTTYATPTCTFLYDANQRLTSAGGQAMGWKFEYSGEQPVASPWGYRNWGNTRTLTAVESAFLPVARYSFEYVAAEAGTTTGELYRVTLPYGAQLRYFMREYTFAGNRTIRENYQRYLRASAGAAETAHYFWRDDSGDPGRSAHAAAAVHDGTGRWDKAWYFDGQRRPWRYDERGPGGEVRKRVDFTWGYAVPAEQKYPYVSATQWTEFGKAGTGCIPITLRSEQTLDQYGNLKQSKRWDYDNRLNTERTTTYEYLHEVSPNAGQYLSRYIRNRLTKVTVTGGTDFTIVPLEASYDGASLTAQDLPSLVPMHDTPNFGVGLPWRGNATTVKRQGSQTTVTSLAITGMVRSSIGPDGTFTATPSAVAGWAVPGAVSTDGVPTTLGYDGAFRLTTAVGAAGDTTTFGWDPQDRPLTKRLPDGTTAEMTYTYNPPLTKQVLRKHNWVKQHLDGLGRVVKEERGYGGIAAGSTEVTESVVETQYEPCACSPFWKVKRVSRPRQPGAALVWTEYEYDEIGRTKQVTHAPAQGTSGNGGITTYAYDVGFPNALRRATVQVTDPAGRWKTTTTDAFGEVREVIEPRPGGGTYSTFYEYNRIGKLRKVTMPRDGVTQERTFEYNAQGQLTATVLPETGRTTYTYDSRGRLETQTDALNRMRKWVYTGGRLTKVERYYSGALSSSETTDYGFDGYGRLSTVDYGNAHARFRDVYGWTAAGQLQTKQLQHPWGTLTASWTYDNEGRLSTVVYPGGISYAAGYDAAKRMNALTGGGESYTAAYDWRGLMTQLQSYPGGSNQFHLQDWGYNDAGMMTSHTVQVPGSPAPVVTNVSYNYGGVPAAGKLASVTQNGSTVSYSYDALGRLESATGAQYTQGYVYDGFGNLKQKTGTFPNTFNVDSATNRIPGQQDAVGNTIGYGWDADNRMVANGPKVYAYGSSNQRVLELSGGTAVVTFRAAGVEMGWYMCAYVEEDPVN